MVKFIRKEFNFVHKEALLSTLHKSVRNFRNLHHILYAAKALLKSLLQIEDSYGKLQIRHYGIYHGPRDFTFPCHEWPA